MLIFYAALGAGWLLAEGADGLRRALAWGARGRQALVLALGLTLAGIALYNYCAPVDRGLEKQMRWAAMIERRYLQREFRDAALPFRAESVASSCMYFRKSLVDRLGEWDEGYYGYFVDTDWCYRLSRHGVQVYCVPAARIVHHEQNSSKRKRGASRIWMFHRSALRFYRKNHTFGWMDPRAILAASSVGTAGLNTSRAATKRRMARESLGDECWSRTAVTLSPLKAGRM